MRSGIVRVLGPALLCLVLAACQADEERLEEHMSRAQAFVDEEQHREAIIEYKNVLQIDPNHAAAHYGLAKAFLRTRMIREGFWELRETVRLDPANLNARLEFSQMALIAREFKEALEQAEAVIEADPQNIKAYLLKGQALQSTKGDEEALPFYKKAVEVGPEDPSALQVVGRFHDMRGDVEETEVLFTKLVEVWPTQRSYTVLGRFLAQRFQNQRDDEAEKNLRMALEVAKDAGERSRGTAQVAAFLRDRGRFPEAVEILEAGIEAEEDSLDLIYLLARFHRAEGNTAEADALIEHAAESAGDRVEPHLVLSAYLGRKGDLDGALEAANRAIEVNSELRGPRLRKAELLIEIGFRRKEPDRIAEGRRIAEEILADEPTHPGSLFVIAKVDLANQNVDDAILGLRAAIDAREDWAEAHYMLGTALGLKGDRKGARSELGRALEIDPGLIQANKVLAQIHFQLDEHEYAVEAGRRYLRGNEDDIETRILVAQSLVRLGQLSESLAELTAVPEDKRDAAVNYAIGRVYFGLRDLDEARKHLELAYELNPTNADILRSLMALDRRQERMADTVARVNHAAREKPEDAKIQRLQGTVAMFDGRAEEAEAAFKKSIELDPEDLTGYERLARYYANSGRLEETVKIYEQAIEVKPNEARLYHFLGVLYELGGDRDRAISQYEEAIKRDPNLAEAKNNLAFAFADKGVSLDRALDLAQEAKTQLPNNSSVADTLGWVLYRRGVPSAAISYLKEAEAGTEPGDANLGVVRHHLALAYEANGDTVMAREALKRALEDLDGQIELIRARGGDPQGEPPWAVEARSMLARLDAEG